MGNTSGVCLNTQSLHTAVSQRSTDQTQNVIAAIQQRQVEQEGRAEFSKVSISGVYESPGNRNIHCFCSRKRWETRWGWEGEAGGDL